MDIGDDLDGREGMIECHYGVEKHEQRFRDLKYILHGSSRSRLEVANTIVSNIANSTSDQRR